jgi:hypothetical protein
MLLGNNAPQPPFFSPLSSHLDTFADDCVLGQALCRWIATVFGLNRVLGGGEEGRCGFPSALPPQRHILNFQSGTRSWNWSWMGEPLTGLASWTTILGKASSTDTYPHLVSTLPFDRITFTRNHPRSPRPRPLVVCLACPPVQVVQ